MPTSASNHERPEQLGITIDGPTSRDLDDAFWVSPTSTGVLLAISIADVTQVVPRGSAIDEHAREMGFTRYLPTRIDPMLPAALSEHAVSLLPEQERSAITLTLPVSTDGQVGTT